MRYLLQTLLTVIGLLICLQQAEACTVTPSFTYSVYGSCGTPAKVTLKNTSTGTYKKKARYWWANNGVLIDSTIGLDSLKTLLSAGNNKIKLFVRDSTGCVDSSSATTITVTTSASKIADQNGNYTYTPVFYNCLQYGTDPDTFTLNITPRDSMKKMVILWGDGSIDTSTKKLNPKQTVSHLYNSIGTYKIKIISQNASCVDTIYAVFYSQRVPTAGMIGPPAGNNRGCVPHTIRLINNSYNITDNTTFTWDFGDGSTYESGSNSFADTVFHKYTKGICAATVRITAKNVCGSSFTTWNPIDISDKDKARVTYDQTCDGKFPYVFHNVTADRYCLLPDPKQYFWDFGDGTTVGWINNTDDQEHHYAKEGDYVITLIARNLCGDDTVRVPIKVYYIPRVGFIYSSNYGCKPLAVSVTDTSKGRGITRLWSVTDKNGTTTFTDSIKTYIFTNPGTYSIKLTVSNICGTVSKSISVYVKDNPKAAMATIGSGCAPLTVNYTNNSTTSFGNPKFFWDFGDGTTSTLTNPASKIYTVPGTYTIKLAIADSCGTDTVKQMITVFGLPTAKLTGDTTGCTFDSLQFNNLSTNAATYTWDFGDGSGNVVKTTTGLLKHMYSKTGPFIVTLIASSGAGCADTATHNLLIKPGAKAVFTTNKDYSCAPATFKYTNQSIYGKDYYWYVNGKLVSTAFNLSDTTLTTDTTKLHVTLYVTSASSCLGDSAIKNIFTAKNPVAGIANSIDSGCGPYNITLNNTSQYAVKYDWNMGNGVITSLKNPNATYPASLQKDTLYKTKLMVYNWLGCKDSTSSVIKVFPKPVAQFTPNVSAGCGPLPVSFTNQSNAKDPAGISSMTFKWNLGNGKISTLQNPSNVYLASNYNDTIYTITLSAYSKHGCSDVATKDIRVYPDPYVDFLQNATDGCGPLNVNFTNISDPKDTGSISIMSFAWNMGNGTTSTKTNTTAKYLQNPTKDTLYTITLIGTSEHGCKDTTSKQVRVYPFPLARFTVDKPDGCAPLIFTTKNTSIPHDTGSIAIMSFKWSLTNGYSTSLRDISQTLYSHPTKDTTYYLTLEATSEHGCKDTLVKPIVVHPKPVAKFDVPSQTGCAPLTMPALDKSVNAAQYYWNDGSNFNPGTKIHQFTFQGLRLSDSLYTVKLVVVSPFGCVSDTAAQQVLVVGRPLAAFITNLDSACVRQNIKFSNNSLGGIKYNWNFGDGATSKSVNPPHTYKLNPASGRDSTFMVSLEAISSQGCKDTAYKQVYMVNRPVEPMLTSLSTGCADLKVSFAQKSTRFKTVVWDFGDGISSAFTDTVTHVYYNQTGVTKAFKAILLRQSFNCYDTASQYIYVQPKPIAALDASRIDPCNNGEHKFTSLSSGNNSYTWNINNGYVSSSASFSMILPASEQQDKDTAYKVVLKIKNNYGCVDSTIKMVNVKPKLILKFNSNTKLTCEKGSVTFVNQSTNSQRFFWDFGDGGFSNEANPTYTYGKYGVYTVTLFGYDKDGCADSSDKSHMLEVLEKPKPDFIYNPLAPKLPNANVTFTNLTKALTNASSLVYEWTFGDNSNGPERYVSDPVHTYSVAGNMFITLKAYNGTCWDKVTKPIFIDFESPVLSFDADVKSGCMPLTVHFINNSQFGDTYRWIFGDGSESTEKEPTHTYKYDGVFDVTLVVTGPGGISSFIQKQMITVYPRPVADFITVKRNLNLPNAIFTMDNRSENANRYDWQFSDSSGNVLLTSTKESPYFETTVKGKYNVRLIALNEHFCADTLYKPGYLNTDYQGVVYVPNVFSPNKDGKNDGFRPVMKGVVEDNYKFMIFNRWGEKIYESTDIESTWDGTYLDKNCEQDVYVWIVTGQFVNSDIFEKKGTVTLLR